MFTFPINACTRLQDKNEEIKRLNSSLQDFQSDRYELRLQKERTSILEQELLLIRSELSAASNDTSQALIDSIRSLKNDLKSSKEDVDKFVKELQSTNEEMIILKRSLSHKAKLIDTVHMEQLEKAQLAGRLEQMSAALYNAHELAAKQQSTSLMVDADHKRAVEETLVLTEKLKVATNALKESEERAWALDSIVHQMRFKNDPSATLNPTAQQSLRSQRETLPRSEYLSKIA